MEYVTFLWSFIEAKVLFLLLLFLRNQLLQKYHQSHLFFANISK